MDHTYTLQSIKGVLNASRRTHEAYTVALLSVLDHTFAKTYAERALFDALCRERLTPALVHATSDTHNILASLTDTLGNMPVPLLNEHDVETTLHILHGLHRQAVRLLFAAINAEKPDAQIQHDLLALSGNLRPDLETDPRGMRMDAKQREIAMLRLLAFRDDVPPVQLFLALFNACRNTRTKLPLSEIAFRIINPVLIDQLAQRPASWQVVHLLETTLNVSTHTPPQYSRHEEQQQKQQQERHEQKQHQQQQHQQQQHQQQRPHQHQHQQTERLLKERAAEIFKQLDLNHDNVVSQSEAIKCCRNKSEYAEAIGLPLGHVRQEGGTKDAFQMIYNRIDSNNNKTLEMDEILAALREINGHNKG